MSSKTIYQPFTYCITFILTGQRYYGVRYAKGCHPDQLWTTYFTSSKVIKFLIEEYGKDSFTYQVRRMFSTREEANSWETKFLTRINAAKSPYWLNGTNGGHNFNATLESTQKMLDSRKKNGTLNTNTPESIQKRLDTRKKNGTLNTQTPESIQKAKDTKKERGIDPPMKNPDNIQKAKDTKKKNNTGMDNPIIVKKALDTKKERDTGPDNPEISQKMLDTKKKNNTGMDNPEIYQKYKDTMERNGTLNPMKNPETIQKAKDTKKERGVVNQFSVPFLSIIRLKKTYTKAIVSRWYPELKQYY